MWQHVAKEEVVEVTKEAYIPVEHQQQSSLLHLDSECVQVCVCVRVCVHVCTYLHAITDTRDTVLHVEFTSSSPVIEYIRT